MIRRPPRSTQSRSSAASDVYKRQPHLQRPGDLADLRHSGVHGADAGGDPVAVLRAEAPCLQGI